MTIELPSGQHGPVSVKFIQGTITAVDCAAPPKATLTLVAESKTWKLQVQDTQKVVLFGASKFSCSWTNQKAGVSYVQTGDTEGIVLSLQFD